ncbi:MAG: ExbD/TolR family protein [Gemmobacter sp.]
MTALAAARPRRYGFPLTPLADAMFQLLVFFMLSSSLAPYSLIPLTGGAAGSSRIEGTAAPAAPAPDAGARVLVWHLSRGQVRAGTEVMPLSDIASLIPALRAEPDIGVLIFPAPNATVQDLARVTEVLALAGVVRVQIVAGSRAGGG